MGNISKVHHNVACSTSCNVRTKALALRSCSGVKKGRASGRLGRAILRLMRPHAMQITHSKHLTGSFNAHMRTVLFMFADEAFFAGDRANEGALKGLITEDYRVNEGRGATRLWAKPGFT